MANAVPGYADIATEIKNLVQSTTAIFPPGQFTAANTEIGVSQLPQDMDNDKFPHAFIHSVRGDQEDLPFFQFKTTIKITVDLWDRIDPLDAGGGVDTLDTWLGQAIENWPDFNDLSENVDFSFIEDYQQVFMAERPEIALRLIIEAVVYTLVNTGSVPG